MTTKRYDQIESGDIGSFTDGTLWVSCGAFSPDGYVSPDGRIWGYFPFVTNSKLKKDRKGYMQGCADSVTTIWERV